MITTAMNSEKKPFAMHPKKFALWLFILSIVMIFAALTSAYIVQRAERSWLNINIPDVAYISTIVLLLSSVSMQWAFQGARKDQLHVIKIGLLITIILGTVFTILQVIAGFQLAEGGIALGGGDSNPAGDFLYVFRAGTCISFNYRPGLSDYRFLGRY